MLEGVWRTAYMILVRSSWEGGTRILKHTGMCGSDGLLLHKKSLNMGPIFYKNILIHGFLFPKIVKNGLYKSLKMGTFFCQNEGFRGLRHILLSKPNLSTPPGSSSGHFLEILHNSTWSSNMLIACCQLVTKGHNLQVKWLFVSYMLLWNRIRQ